eukprot:6806730-Prymnesium_polylepis.1
MRSVVSTQEPSPPIAAAAVCRACQRAKQQQVQQSAQQRARERFVCPVYANYAEKPLTKALKAATQLECKKKLRLVPEPTPHRPHADFADCQALRARAFAGALFGLPHWRHFYKGAGRAWDRCVGLVRGR